MYYILGMTSTSDAVLEQRAELLDAWVETRRRIARLEAEASRLLAQRLQLSRDESDQHPHHRDSIHRSMVAEYAAAGRVTQGSMEYAFSDAGFLHSGHTAVREAFHDGTISASDVREIVRAAGIVHEAINNGRADAEALALYDAAAVVVAQQETSARTRVHVRELAAAFAESTTTERLARATSERTVSVRAAGDGLAVLTVVLPEHLAAAILDRLTRLARGVIHARKSSRSLAGRLDEEGGPIRPDAIAFDACAGVGLSADDGHAPLGGPAPDARPSRGDSAIFGDGTFTTDPSSPTGADRTLSDIRTIDHVRADLLVDLLLASDPGAAHGSGLDNIQARIQVTVAASTLAGGDDRPAQLDGHGPLHPDIARELAGRSGGWSRLFLDPTGMVVETDNYSPTEGMRRFLRARDQHCRFPGCRMPVHRCQIDHTFDHATGGRTELHNLSHLCVTHHVLKHPDMADDHRWTAPQREDGSIDWFSPLGRRYTDSPLRRVMFI